MNHVQNDVCDMNPHIHYLPRLCHNCRMISFSTWRALKKRMRELDILESDLQEKFILGSGHGGQKIQKTASCVQLKHEPTSIILKCQQSRLRDDNRYHARQMLCDKVEEIVLQEKSKKQQEFEKIRRQKRRRSRRAKQKILEDKAKRSATKQLRKPPSSNSQND